jgi:hypothetical protein
MGIGGRKWHFQCEIMVVGSSRHPSLLYPSLVPRPHPFPSLRVGSGHETSCTPVATKWSRAVSSPYICKASCCSVKKAAVYFKNVCRSFGEDSNTYMHTLKRVSYARSNGGHSFSGLSEADFITYYYDTLTFDHSVNLPGPSVLSYYKWSPLKAVPRTGLPTATVHGPPARVRVWVSGIKVSLKGLYGRVRLQDLWIVLGGPNMGRWTVRGDRRRRDSS